MSERLEALRRRGGIDHLDVRFADLIARLSGEASEGLTLAAALASRATAGGHVCIDLREVAGRPVAPEVAGSPTAPALAPWIGTLRDSAVVGRPGDFRPLVLDDDGRLYLYRYWRYEHDLANDLRERAGADPDGVDDRRLARDLDLLFPRDDRGETDWQRVAAATAALKRLAVVSGGPGTGKTTTVVRILALLLAQAGGWRPAIGLAAPTGKAAARMQEAVRVARESLPAELGPASAIPEDASTLHRLLGHRPGSTRFRHDREHPLPLDVVVVDEASMVDLAMMARLVAALPPAARLILLGDRDQLASVEAGAVLGDLCAGGAGFSEPFRARLEAVTGERLGDDGGDSALRDAVVFLRRSYRFGPGSGIGRLSRAIHEGRADDAVAIARSGSDDLAFLEPIDGDRFRRELIGSIEDGYAPFVERVVAGAAPEEVLDALDRFRVLCGQREGPFGVRAINALAESVLCPRLGVAAGAAWYPGRPVLMTRNDYNLRLFNGDVGVVLPDRAGSLRAAFRTADGRMRLFAPARLAEHDTVWAMTVHKSQGSEFDRVLMVLPAPDSPVLTRELLYTGITRARATVAIAGTEGALRVGVARVIDRSSGLRKSLAG